jgi:signal transduction histidine kinase
VKWTLTLVLFAATCAAQTPSVSCYDVRVLQKTMCTYADGSGVMYDVTDTTSAATEYAPEAWARMKDRVDAEAKAELERREKMAKEMQAETDAEIAKIRADAERDRAALDIHSRKKCQKAGFYWTAGLCTAKH